MFSKQKWEQAILSFWYKKGFLRHVLKPLSALFYVFSCVRFYWLVYFKKPTRFNVPIIIVGNITLGGTGKTPLVEWLVKFLIQEGYCPGIVLRGFKGKINHVKEVTVQSQVREVGDEALFLAKQCQCPVVVGKKRTDAVKQLVGSYPNIDIVIADDGLQHYALARDIEIAVIDGKRRLGNELCLPGGPLREPPSRLNKVDFIVTNGEAQKNEWSMRLSLEPTLFQIHDPKNKQPFSIFSGMKVHAIAGIGNPDRFFNMLKEKGLQLIEHRFSDHHHYVAEDFLFEDDLPIIMTAKDAVKCYNLAKHAWVASLIVNLPEEFGHSILRRIRDGQKTIRNSRLSNLQTTPIVCEGK